MSIKDSNVTIMVNDMDKSVSFYQSIGFTIKHRWDNHYAHLTAPGITIGIHPTNETKAASDKISIGFTTDNFEKTKRSFKQLSYQYSIKRGRRRKIHSLP